jgi:hypothetical protein
MPIELRRKRERERKMSKQWKTKTKKNKKIRNESDWFDECECNDDDDRNERQGNRKPVINNSLFKINFDFTKLNSERKAFKYNFELRTNRQKKKNLNDFTVLPKSNQL